MFTALPDSGRGSRFLEILSRQMITLALAAQTGSGRGRLAPACRVITIE